MLDYIKKNKYLLEKVAKKTLEYKKISKEYEKEIKDNMSKYIFGLIKEYKQMMEKNEIQLNDLWVDIYYDIDSKDIYANQYVKVTRIKKDTEYSYVEFKGVQYSNHTYTLPFEILNGGLDNFKGGDHILVPIKYKDEILKIFNNLLHK